MKMWWLYLFCVFLYASADKIETVFTTQLFEIVLDPPLFNWTYEGIPTQFVYRSSLRNTPDLPQWMKYVFSQRYHSGFLYGVAPINLCGQRLQIEIVALNKKNYETRLNFINIQITEKFKPAKYEVHMKIDNLDVEDMFEEAKIQSLKNIFRKQLWKESVYDLYVTFLASAVQLGARKPLDPNEGDGIILRLGSEHSLSLELLELQEEIKPLWKVPSCPRDYKRTSVERFFRKAGFVLDWCSFRLIDNSNSALQQSNEELKSADSYEGRWKAVQKDEVPKRRYTSDFIFTILIPMVLMVIFALGLSVILCFHHERISRTMNDYLNEIDQHSSIQHATESLRHLSTMRELSLSPDPILLSKTTSSPNATISRGVHCRPSPPPYVRPKFKPNF